MNADLCQATCTPHSGRAAAIFMFAWFQQFMLSSFLRRVGIRAGDCYRCPTIHCPSPEKYTLSLHSQCRCNTAVKRSPDGGILSTKYSSEVLWARSVKIIAEKYCGACRFESANGMFRASVLCPIKM